MQYAKITARVALMVADSTDDPDENPDEVYATGGQVVLSPLVKRVQGAGLFRLPQPITADIDAQGYLSLNANREVLLLDLGDPTLNPSVPRDQGAWKVEFKNVKFGTTPLAIDSFFINPDAADNDIPSGVLDALGNPVQKNDLSVLAPIPTGSGGAGITRGPAGPGVPAGGLTSQVLTKASGNDYDTQWADQSGGGGTALTSYADQVEVLPDYPTEFPPDLTGVTPADVGAQPAGDYATNTALTSGLAGKAALVHTHTSSQVTDFTTAVDARVQNIVGAAPAALDTLAELANALGDDANFAGTVTTELATKYVKPGTGIPETDLDTTTQGKIDGALQSIPAATATVTGAVRLTGDLGGTATAPTVPGLASKISTSQVGAANGVAGLDTGSHVPIAQATAGITLTVLSTTSWPARPTSRTDVYVRWIDAGALGTNPSGALDGDSLTAAS